MKKVIKFIEDNILNNKTVCVACSGGPDSMCLLSLLCLLKDKKNLKIVVAHVNHKLREESDEEELLVKDFCDKNGISFELCCFDEFKTEKFSEDVARRKRYLFFDSVVKKYKASYLLTAHHGDDLIETVLMRLTRGSNLNGYLGYRKKIINNKYTILRPLIYVTKEDIISYLNKEDIKYAIDKTNDSLEYTRNRYRHVVLPFLKNEEKNVHSKYLQFSEELEECNDFIIEYINRNDYIVDNSIVIHNIIGESDFIIKKTIELLISDIQKKDILDVNNKNINDIMKMLNSKTNKSVDLNNGYKCIKEYDFLKIVKSQNKGDFSFILEGDVTVNNYKIKRTFSDVGDSNYEIRIDSDDIKLPLIVRNRRDGDKIEVKNMKGSKKVKDIFIDEKVNNSLRDMIPIVVDGNNEIIWIPGIKKSKFAKDKNEKYDIIFKCEVK